MALCPFTRVPVERGCIFTRTQMECMECMGDRCQLWDKALMNCGLITQWQNVTKGRGPTGGSE
jgi:hypothetical protein